MNSIDRFMAKVDKRGDNECWNWKGSDDGHGYGEFWFEGKKWKAPRFSWVLNNGVPIPKGLLVCHKCDNPSCVNPNHLFLGTMSDNIMDCVKKGRHPHPIGKGNSTHCPQGHPYSGDNLYVSPRGERRCRTCQRVYSRRQELKRQARNQALLAREAPKDKHPVTYPKKHVTDGSRKGLVIHAPKDESKEGGA